VGRLGRLDLEWRRFREVVEPAVEPLGVGRSDLPEAGAPPHRDEEEEAPAHDPEGLHELVGGRQVRQRLVGHERVDLQRQALRARVVHDLEQQARLAEAPRGAQARVVPADGQVEQLRCLRAAVDELGLERFHLVVHDIGGPVGLELAAAMPERVRSITVLNTVIEVDGFRRPWMMEPFARRGIGEAWLATMRGPVFAQLMYYAGVKDRSAVSGAELAAYVTLLKREDGGRAFLRIMRGFERTREKQELYVATVGDSRRPVQVVWGSGDPALPLKSFGEQARAAAKVPEIHALPGKHFLQEDCAPAIADRIADIADASLSDTKDHDTSALRD